MVNAYKCDKCDEGFNLKIKLNRHILNNHRGTAKVDEYDCLTNKEKIRAFDELKQRYHQASEQFSNEETKLSNLQSKLKSLSLKNNFKQKKYRGLDDTTGSYEHIESDDTIPSGWKSSWKKLDFCNKKTKIYWAPNGKFCSSRREAILYMLEHLDSGEEDLVKMKSGLVLDGWKEDRDLAGWYSKRVATSKDKSSKAFISPDFNHFKSPRAVLSHLLKFSSEKEITEFVRCHVRTDVTSLQWLYNPDIPFPWRVAFMNGTKFQLYLSPDGSVFNNLKSAVEFMSKDPEVSSARRKCFSVMMERMIYQVEMAEGDWVRDSTLPDGWMKIKKPGQTTSYLSPEGVVLGTKVGVMEYLRRNGAAGEVKPLPPKQETVWMADDQSVPEGWLVSADGKRFKDHTGKHFFSRLEALKSMENYCPADLEKMKEGLTTDNWNREELPSGWLVKRNKKGEKSYLSPSLEVVKTLENVIRLLREEGRDEEDIDKVKSSGGWTLDPRLPECWRVSLPSMSLSHQKRFMDPDGKIYLGTRQVYQHFLMADPVDERAVNIVRRCLEEEGWAASQFIPENWMVRRLEQGGKEAKAQYISEKGEKFKNAEKAVTYLIVNNFSKEIIEKFKENALNTKYYDDNSLPSGWKVGESSIGHGRKAKRFLSPDGKFLTNRVTAAKYMLENKYSEEDIELMRRGFEEDGWQESDKIPSGFLLRTKTEGGERSKPQFLCLKEFNVIQTVRQMLIYLEENDYSQEFIEKIKTISRPKLNSSAEIDISDDSLDVDDTLVIAEDEDVVKDTSQRDEKKLQAGKASSKFNWVEDESSLPRGWKISEMKNSLLPGAEKTLATYRLLTPDGVFLNSRAQAVRFMRERSEFSKEETEFMIDNLHRDGWTTSENLPHNWRYRFIQKNMHFLNADFEQLRSFTKAYRYMESNGYSSDILETFKISFYRTQKEETFVKAANFEAEGEILDNSLEKRKIPSDSEDDRDSAAKRPRIEEARRVWTRDQTLPEDWLLATTSGGEIIKSRDGEEFSGRKEAIDFMIREGYSPEGIFKLWNTLHLDGWLDDPEFLPTGWKKKLFSGTFHFLSPLMEEIRGTEALLDRIESNQTEYDSEDVSKVKKWIAVETL